MSDSSYSTADLHLGCRVIDVAYGLLAWGTALAVAWSCSTVMVGIIMFIITAVVMGLLCQVASLYTMYKLPEATIANIGGFVGSTAARVTGLFSRKVTA